MNTERQTSTGRRRAGRTRVRETGAVPIAALSILTMLALAAGLSPYGARMLERTGPSVVSPPPPSAGIAAPPRDLFLPARDGARDEEREPAIARASETGLQRMRVQFAQGLVAPGRPGADGFEALPGAPAPAGAALGATASDAARDSRDDTVRDVRDPRARAESRTSPPPRIEGPRTVSLPASTGPTSVPFGEAAVTWIGDATLLIRAQGFTVLADPNFLRRGEIARLGWGRAAPRRADPAMTVESLPRVDAVLVSRLRDDRFDRIVRRLLPRDVPIVAPQHARAELVAMGFSSVHGLAPWQSLRLVRDTAWLQVTATPTRGAPAMLASLAPASNGALVEVGRGDGAEATRVWISGETAVDDAFADELAQRLGDLDLAVLQVGGHALPMFASAGTMDAAAARRLAARIAPRNAVAVGLDDHSLRDAPLARLQAASSDAQVVLPERGATVRLVSPQRWASAEIGSVR